MGQVSKIIKKNTIKLMPLFNKRMSVDLCENIHIHYRNLRLEFEKKEFLLFLKLLKSLDVEEIEKFNYSPNSFKEVLNEDLPEKTEWNKRMVIEEQVKGHLGGSYHIHYRNLRIEVRELEELGY